MALNFTDDETEHLIGFYHANESLYNRNHYEYTSRAVRRRIINEISERLAKPPSAIIAKIECLRTQFALSLRKQRASENEGTPPPKEWRYFRELYFLEPYMAKQIQQGTTIHALADSEEGDPPTQVPLPPYDEYSNQSYDYDNGEPRQQEHPSDEQPGFLTDQQQDHVHEEPQMVVPHDTQPAVLPSEPEDVMVESAIEENGREYPPPVRAPRRRPSKRRHELDPEPRVLLPPNPDHLAMNEEPPSVWGRDTRSLREDDCDAFGRLVAAELRTMGRSRRLVTKREIMSIVYGYTEGELKPQEYS